MSVSADQVGLPSRWGQRMLANGSRACPSIISQLGYALKARETKGPLDGGQTRSHLHKALKVRKGQRSWLATGSPVRSRG